MYNISSFLDEHPGGSEIMMEFAGKNADSMFEDVGHSSQARERLSDFCIGFIAVSNYI